jgi:hypothetical protein
MEIKITGAKQTPSYEVLQNLVTSALDKNGRFTRIARRDKACNYRVHGIYDITFIPERGDAVEIVLEVHP